MTSTVERIVQIVSGAPPQLNGVADFALGIARPLRAIHRIDSVLVVANPDWTGPAEVDGFRLVPFRSRNGFDLASTLREMSKDTGLATTWLLQLSPYGFAKNGAPYWLLDAFRTLAGTREGHRLLVYFHELYATSAPWRRGFWLSPLQRFFARQMAQRADFSFTSMRRYAEELRGWNANRPDTVACLGIPSNVGEPEVAVPIVDRKPQMVVFGTAGLRSRAYGRRPRALSSICDTLGVKTIIDVGPGDPEGLGQLEFASVKQLGAVGAAEVSAILADSQFGYVDYFPGYLAKSGVFAAYCAHGVVPISPRANCGESDGISAGRQYWHPGLGMLDMGIAQSISEGARSWYFPHRLEAHAHLITSTLHRA